MKPAPHAFGLSLTFLIDIWPGRINPRGRQPQPGWATDLDLHRVGPPAVLTRNQNQSLIDIVIEISLVLM